MSTLKTIMARLIAFVKNWNELLTVPAGFLLFYLTPRFFRLFDETAAGYDLGLLHNVFYAMSAMLMINGFAWFILKITFPGIYLFLDEVLEKKINWNAGLQPAPSPREFFIRLSVWQKSVISLFVFSLYLIGTILLAKI